MKTVSTPRRLLLYMLCALALGLTAQAGEDAAALLKASDFRAGLVVHAGCGDGQLLAGLAAALGEKPALLHGLDTDAAAIAKARANAEAQGLNGRVSFACAARLTALPFPDHYVTLLVVDRFEALVEQGLAQSECARVLAPGGTAALRAASGVAPDEKVGWKLVKSDGEWTYFTKPRPEGMDDHTHYNYDAACTRTSKDQFAGPPGQVIWVDGPNWTCSPSGPVTQLSAGGRTFSVINESLRTGSKRQSPRTYLYAHDGYNGVRLWRQPTASGKLTTVATKERVYCVLQSGGPLCALDPLMGKVLKQYETLAAPEWILFDNGKLVGSAKRSLHCVDAESGKELWTRPYNVEPSALTPNAALVRERLYLLVAPRKSKDPPVLACLNVANGEDVWKREIAKDLKSEGGSLALCTLGAGTLVVGEWNGKGATDGGVHGFGAEDGAHRWFHDYRLVTSGRPSRHKGSSFVDGYFIDGLYWYLDGNGNGAEIKGEGTRRANGWYGLDPQTGEVKQKLVLKKDEYIDDSCHRTQATERFLLGGHCHFYERAAQKYTPRSDAVHNGCGFGMLPANGLFYSGSFYLDYYLQGEFATAVAAPLVPDKNDAPGRLVKGPAFGAQGGAEAAASDWPMLRADDHRSLGNAASVPAGAKERWQVQLGSRLSQPVAVGETVYVSDVDGLRIAALDAASGKIKWSAPLGSRAYAPPAYHKGLLLAGCADGWVYCFKADDGALAWRFRAAPIERHIVARGRVESVWPVEGGVVVKDGIAYFTAGRHPEIDGGVDVFAMEPFGAKIVWHQRLTEGGKVRMMACGENSAGFSPGRSYLFKDGGKGGNLKISDDAMDLDRLDCAYAAGDAAKGIWEHARVRAIAKTAGGFFTAGPPPEKIEADRPFGAIDREEDDPSVKTSELCAFDASGKLLSKTPVDALPEFDGMAAAGGRLFLCTQDGKLRCYGNP